MPPITPGDSSSIVNQMNQNIAQQNTNQITQIFKDDAGTRRVLLGKGLNGFYGLKVSPAGTDVYDAADSELIFNSGQDIFKIVSSGSTTFDITGTTQNISVAHGLSFAPIVFATIEASFNGVSQGLTAAPSMVLGANSGVGNNYVISAFCQIRGSDATNIKFFVGVLSPIRYNGTIHYYILQETASS